MFSFSSFLNKVFLVPLDRWRTSPRVLIRDAWSDLHNLHKCECEIPSAKSTTIDLTDTESKKEIGTPVGSPSGQIMIDLTNFGGFQSTEQTDMPADTLAAWIKNSLYVLNEKDRQLITSPYGMADDGIIQASQLLLAQHFPDIEGLQPPTLEQIQGFRVHSGEFLQLFRHSHWIPVSNVGCDKGVVHVYDTMYSSIPLSTVHTITRLVLYPISKLTLKMVNADLQRNCSDCGVLCLAIAFDVLSARASQVAAYTHQLLRQHLCKCLEECHFSPFPS